ncbi:hypothetical protein AVEN_209857-1 [Araneus ventricosus]|uniref:Tc1-like transposase DDE domain-containing protein n=1 Tax=Araneus ventricosus TaxID=182803 RepID=A0A4Y2IS37_ARAVE|nr:hypothetical protein AVEN_209857-1 [Araneus ventricosus]
MELTCQQGTVQSGGASAIVRDVCSWHDMGPLIPLETTLTGDRYLSILPDHLHLFMSIVHSDGLGQFQHDNATPHASRVTTKWLQEHSSDFRHFHWPPKSPEMNVIEDIRDGLLHAVEKRSPPPCTPVDLLTALQNSWCQFPPRYLQTSVESTPATSFGVTSACSWGPDTILRCTSFSGSSVYIAIIFSSILLQVKLTIRNIEHL